MGDIEKGLDAARPSADPSFAEKVRRLTQPEALGQRKPWMWSPGIGTEVWEMFCACIMGDLETVKRLVAHDPSLVRAHYEYRTPLSFAVRENHLAVADYLLDHGAVAVSLGDPVEMARERGHAEMVALLERSFQKIHGASAERARRLRRVVREHLASMPAAEVPGDTLPPSTARRLIARAEGFAGWREPGSSRASFRPSPADPGQHAREVRHARAGLRAASRPGGGEDPMAGALPTGRRGRLSEQAFGETVAAPQSVRHAHYVMLSTSCSADRSGTAS